VQEVNKTSPFPRPDPDKFYSINEVPAEVDSPVAELLQHNREVIRRQVRRRQERVVAQLEAAAAVQEADAVEQPKRVLPQPPVQIAEKRVTDIFIPNRPNEIPDPNPMSRERTVVTVNSYLHRMRQNNAVLAANSRVRAPGDVVDPPPCHAQETCPYCTGPKMMQRFMCLERVFQLNHEAYGREYAEDMLRNV